MHFKDAVKNILIKMMKTRNRVFIGDTTLRDGEQAPGASLNVDEKLQIARQLDLLGVDSIEAGFPVSSKEDFEAVKTIANNIRRPVITALCRCKREDIDCAREALKGARRWGLALFAATSPMLLKHSLQKNQDEALKVITDSIRYAKKFTESVAFGPEDASRTEPTFLYKVYTEAIDSGALVIGFTDTVGRMTPDEVKNVIYGIRKNVPNLDKAFLAAHFHNDLGFAVANTLAAITSGVNIVQCTINGIGERAGNTSLEEVVMALRTRSEYYRMKTSINAKELYNASKLVAKLTGLSVSSNKPIVGENVFATAAGIHQAALLKDRETYEIMKPEDVGQSGTKIILDRHSGKHALLDRLRRMNIKLPEASHKESIDELYRRFKDLAATKKIINDKDLLIIAKEVLGGK